MIYRQPPATKWRGGRMTSLPVRRAAAVPPNVWINQSICELDLTRDDHLLQSPGAFRPEFSWRRRGRVWTRQPLQRYLDARSRYVTVDSFQGVDLRTFGYAYSGTGPVERFSFTAMNRTLIVLVGAGLSLVLGFLFWRFPWTRNAQTFLIVAFLFSFLSLWLLEPIQVLLQPAPPRSGAGGPGELDRYADPSSGVAGAVASAADPAGARLPPLLRLPIPSLRAGSGDGRDRPLPAGHVASRSAGP